MNVNAAAKSAQAHTTHTRHGNFGALNSAIMRGDLEAAQTAFNLLGEAKAPKGPGTQAALDAVGQAIGAGDIEAARKALAEFRTGRTGTPPATATGGTLGDGTSTISLLA